MMVSDGFHDATLEEANEYENELELKLDVWDGIITIRFIDLEKNELKDKIGQILRSSLVMNDLKFLWTIEEGFGGWTDGVDHDTSANGAFIKCSKILWHMDVHFDS